MVNYIGVEENGTTRFEVQIPLNSGDTYDKVLETVQTYPFIITLGSEDSFDAYHLTVAGGQLVLDI